MKKVVIIIVIVAVLGSLSFLGYRRLNKEDNPTASLQTTQVQRGNLVVTVAGASNIASKAETSLSFRTTGKVKAVHVHLGDRVEAGQVLMELDTTDLEVDVAKARLSLTTAEAQLAKLKTPPTDAELQTARANVESAQEKLDQVKAGPTAAELAAAQANVQSAQEKLNQVKAGPSKSQLATAEAAIKTAEDNYQKVLARPNPEDINEAKLKLDQARNSLWASQSQRDSTCGAVARGAASSAQCNSANAQVANAEISVQLAEIAYQQAQTPATAAEIASAAAQVQQAKDNLKQLQESPTAGEIAAAEAEVKRAQDNLESLRKKPTPAELAAAQAQLAQAKSQLEKLTAGPTAEDLASSEAQVEQARLALQQAQRRLEDAKLVALFAGTVTGVNYREGEYASTSLAAVTLADLTSLKLEVPLAEMDVVRVAVGQQVNITLDALSDVTLRGQVIYVSPVAKITQGVVNYPVTIEIRNPDPAVRAGMTASAAIIVEQRENVLLVPNRAVRTTGRQRIVEVLFQGQVIPTQVSTGANNDSMTEVTSGLREGDAVVLRSATTTSQTGTGPGRFMMFGGGPSFSVGPGR